MNERTYLVGQRVIVLGTHIGIICDFPNGITLEIAKLHEYVLWGKTKTPRWMPLEHVAPLPNGQL